MKSDEKKIFTFPSRDVVTNNQITNCLQVIGNLGHLLTAASRYGESTTELPAQAKAAAVSVFERACAALDCILVDRSRFDIRPQETFEAQVTEAHTENLKFLAAQTAASKELLTPHFQQKPTLLKLSDGNWAAFVGEVSQLERSIVGIGNTPENALFAFDESFAGRTTEFMRAWIIQHEHRIRENYEKSLDTARDQPTNTTKKIRRKHPRDRKDPGPNS